MNSRYLSVSPQISSLKKNENENKHQKSPFLFFAGFLILSQCTLQGPPKVIVLREGEALAQQGDTVYSIAHKYGVPVRALVDANGLVPPYTLSPDQKLVLPCHANPASSSFSPAPCPQSASQGPHLLEGSAEVQWEDVTSLESKAAQKDQRPINPSLIEEIRKSDSAGSQKEGGGIPAHASSKVKKERLVKLNTQKQVFFSSPVQNAKGRPKENGICLTVKSEEKVHSAASGTVLFAGSRTTCEDPLVLIQHENGWLTAYGPFDKISVSKGQAVTTKTPLGTITPGKELYFEMRKDRKIVNPMIYIK